MVSEVDILKFLSSGSGNGSGDGSGRGSGNGSGYGYGSGSGNGSGRGSGNGYDRGSGNGSGDGYGRGYGRVSGNGSGDGYGIKSINGHTLYEVDNVRTIFYSIHGDYAKCAAIKHNTELIDCYVAKYKGYFAHGETLAEAVDAARLKYEEKRPLSERIDSFVSEFPSLQSEGTGEDFFKWHNTLTGSCVFGRNQFCEIHNIDMDAHYTVEFFLYVAKNDYGKDVIRQVKERYSSSIVTDV